MPVSEEKNPLLAGVTAGYLILVVHLLLVIGLAAAVVFIQTLAQYIEYILAGGLILIIASAYFFYRILKNNGRQIIKTMSQPGFAGSNVTVSLLGGLASISIRRPEGADENSQSMLTYQALPALPASSSPRPPQQELFRLAQLYEQGLLNKDEFARLKADILDSPEDPDLNLPSE
ncbi:MAG: SHOCT domain-containing protein [Deltaproteobacteria bacterium]|nr:SHOCT domain-containing protein [Deltaproteobacteria bacterium]